jgi:hypothetical protein
MKCSSCPPTRPLRARHLRKATQGNARAESRMTWQRGLLHRNSCVCGLPDASPPFFVPAACRTALPKLRGARSLLNRPLACLARGRFLEVIVPRLLGMYWMWWWLVEFVVLDIVATVALLSGYLAVMIRKAVV